MTKFKNNIKPINTIVIKIGTSCLVYENGSINYRKLEYLSRILSDLVNREKKVVLVSSGAIGCGRKCLGMAERPQTLQEKQMAAAVGQGLLMELYHKFFSEYLYCTHNSGHERFLAPSKMDTRFQVTHWNGHP